MVMMWLKFLPLMIQCRSYARSNTQIPKRVSHYQWNCTIQSSVWHNCNRRHGITVSRDKHSKRWIFRRFSLNCVPNHPIDNKSELVQVMVRHLTDHKPLPQQILTHFSDAYMPHLGLHDDVIKWKHFSRYWSLVREIHRSPMNSPHKGQWDGALMFSLMWAWINGLVNNGKAGELRRHCAHYVVTVMIRTVSSV